MSDVCATYIDILVQGRRWFLLWSHDGPVTLLRIVLAYQLRMKKSLNNFHTHKKPLEIQNCAYTYRIEPMMSSVWPAYGQRMTSVCQRMTSVWPAYSAYGSRMSSV